MKSTEQINLGIIGYGRWGEIIARKFSVLPNVKLVSISDCDKKRLDLAKSTYPNIKGVLQYQILISNQQIDAVVVAAPIPTHYKITKDSLLKGKHVLCEKPLAMTVKEVNELFTLSTKKNLVLMTDLTYLYNPAITEIKKSVMSHKLGSPLNFHSTRYCPRRGLSGQIINVIWDLLPHDVSIMLYLFGKQPTKISILSVNHTQKGIADIVAARFEFPKGNQAQIVASLLDPSDVKRLVIRGTEGALLFDEKAEETKRLQFFTPQGNSLAIPYFGEPLVNVCQAFISSIQTKKNPLAGETLSVATINVLEKLHKIASPF